MNNEILPFESNERNNIEPKMNPGKSNFAFRNYEICIKGRRQENEYRMENMFTDSKLITKDRKEFNVHRVVLASNVKYFKALFSNNKESEDNIIPPLEDISSDYFDEILGYMYTGEINIGIKEAKVINVVAKFFDLVDLQENAAQVLSANLTIDNCLDYWRHAEEIKSKNETLKVKSLIFILQHIETFLENQILALSFNELIEIKKQKGLNCSEEFLYKQIVTWIKSNYADRQIYVYDLLVNINYSQMSNIFIVNEILEDSQLMEDLNFLKICGQQFQKSLKSMNNNIINKIQQPLFPFGARQRRFLFAENKVYKINYKQDLIEIENNKISISSLSIDHNQSKNYAACTFGINFVILSGGDSNTSISQPNINIPGSAFSKMNDGNFFSSNVTGWQQSALGAGTGAPYNLFQSSTQASGIKILDSPLSNENKSRSKSCNYFCPLRKTFQILPNMVNARSQHKLIALNNCVYACGGFNTYTAECYDFIENTWFSIGSMLGRCIDFDLCTLDNLIYACGGLTIDNLVSDFIERYDSRCGKWEQVCESSKLGKIKSICIDDKIYCLSSKGGEILDIRNNMWINTIERPCMDCTTFDAFESDNTIIVIGKNFLNAAETHTLKYDVKDNIWVKMSNDIANFNDLNFNILSLWD